MTCPTYAQVSEERDEGTDHINRQGDKYLLDVVHFVSVLCDEAIPVNPTQCGEVQVTRATSETLPLSFPRLEPHKRSVSK